MNLYRFRDFPRRNYFRSDKEITIGELAKCDGRDGRPAYIAVNGIVYDVSKEAAWSLDIDRELPTGKDLTLYFEQDYEKSKVLGMLTKVGVIKGNSSRFY